MKPISFILSFVILGLLQTPVEAWGRKGHAMTARVAVRALPEDMPAFFRQAVVELGYLCPEPDRWRSRDREPALWALATRDHGLRMEMLKEPLPPNRYQYLLQYAENPASEDSFETHPGFAPYAITEHSEMLTVNFILWRKAPDATQEQRRIKRQIEQNIIHIAGLLSHFITDTAQPLHTTVHGNGWVSDLPNPNGYTPTGDQLHRRFETVYIEQSIEEDDFTFRVGALHAVGPWLEAAMDHIRASHQHVETLYQFDKQHRFGDGQESSQAKDFTCDRLAKASQTLRDFWYSAWVKSQALARE